MNLFKWNRLAAVFVLLMFAVSFYGYAEVKNADGSSDLTHPHQSWYSGPVERLGTGVGNILTGPLELIYQFKEEMKGSNPAYAIVPGVIKGVTWLVIREVVGVFEVVTFFLPMDPHLEPFNTDWLQL